MSDSIFSQFRKAYYKLIISILMREPEEMQMLNYEIYADLYKHIFMKTLNHDLNWYREKALNDYMIVITKTGKYKIIAKANTSVHDISVP